MSKRRFSDAFPTFASAFGVANTIYNAFKRRRTGFTVNAGSGSNTQKKMRFSKRRRVGSRTITRRRRRGRTGLRRKFTRFSRTLRRKGILAIETKYSEGLLDNFTIEPWDDTDPTLSPTRNGHVTAIAQGINASQRIGGKIWIRKLRLHIFVSAHPTAGLNEQYIRVFVIRDLAPLVPDVSASGSTRIGYYLQATGTNANLNLMPWQYINSYRAPRPQILYTALIKVSRETGSDFQYKAWKKTINVFKPCHYDSASANTDVGKGQIYCFWYTNETNVVAPPKVEFAWRVSYTDA